jgi:hypothetical protein
VSEELTSRFSELVRRELGATSVSVAGPDDEETPGALIAPLADGRRVEARFDKPVADPESQTRRLEILVRAFESVLFDDEPSPKKRAPISVSLHDELKALTMRCGALDALVIDAHSPVVWASASKGTTVEVEETPVFPEEAKAMLHLVRESHRGALLALAPPPKESDEGDTATPSESFNEPKPDLDSAWEPPPAANEAKVALTTRAIEQVRRLPQIESLHRGGHLAHTGHEPDFGYVARSFAGIYALVLVFDGPMDDIRIERAIRDGLPRIERLVLALPPLDPDPVPAGVVALRPRRRR